MSATCFDCGIELNRKPRKDIILRCEGCHKKHAQRLAEALQKILAEACKACIRHFECYQQNDDGTLKSEHIKCSKMSFERKIELIGDLCIYHPILNPQGYKISKHEAK